MLSLPSQREGKDYLMPIKKPSAKNDSSGLFTALLSSVETVPSSVDTSKYQRKEPQKNKGTVSSIIQHTDVIDNSTKEDICPTSLNTPLFVSN